MNPTVVIYSDRKTNKITNVSFYNNKEQHPIEEIVKKSEEWNANPENPTYTKVITDPIIEAAFSWVRPQISPFKNTEELIESISDIKSGIENYLYDLERITNKLNES